MKKGGSGIYSNRKHKDAFDFFIQHSTFEYLNKGSNGVTIVGNLNEGIDSPYYHLSMNKFQTPVNKLLIKLAAINTTAGIEIGIGNNLYITSCISSSFEKEANFQINLFKKTSDYFSPLCPAIIYYDIIKNDFIDLLQFENRKDRETIYTLNRNLTEENCKLGIIGMEFADEYVTMYDEIHKWRDIKKESLSHRDHLKSNKMIIYLWVTCAYLILEMTLKTGYSHGDFHLSNIMMLKNGHDFNDGLSHFLLIDFGLVRKIDNVKMEQIRRLVDEEKYTDALRMICTIPRADEEKVLDHPVFYGYLCGTYDLVKNKNTDDFPDNFNKMIGDLFNEQKNQIETKIKKQKTHKIKKTTEYLQARGKTLYNIRNRNYTLKPNKSIIIKKTIVTKQIEPTIPMTEYLQSKLFDKKKKEIKLNYFNHETQPNINNMMFKILINWIHDVIFTMMNQYTKSENIKIFIKVCYNIVYLMDKNPNIRKSNFQLIGLVALYFSKFHHYITNMANDDIFVYLNNYISDKAYGINTIKNEVNKQSELFENVFIDTFYNHLSESEINKLNKLSKDDLVNTMILPDIYNNPSNNPIISSLSRGDL